MDFLWLGRFQTRTMFSWACQSQSGVMWRGWGWQLSWHSIIIDHRKFSSLFPNPTPRGGSSCFASHSSLDLKMKTRKVYPDLHFQDEGMLRVLLSCINIALVTSRIPGVTSTYLFSNWYSLEPEHSRDPLTPVLSTLNNIYKYLGDLLCAGWPVPGSPETLVRARDTQSSDKVCYWQHLEKCKQTIRGRQRDGAPEDQAPLPHCGHNTCRWVFCDISLSLTLASYQHPSRLNSYLNAVIC